MIEITIGGVTAVRMKNGQIKLAGKGDRLEADPKNESYHVEKGHAVFVETTVGEIGSGKEAENIPETGSEKNAENLSGTDFEEKPKQTKTRKPKKTDGEGQG